MPSTLIQKMCFTTDLVAYATIYVYQEMKLRAGTKKGEVFIALFLYDGECTEHRNARFKYESKLVETIYIFLNFKNTKSAILGFLLDFKFSEPRRLEMPKTLLLRGHEVILCHRGRGCAACLVCEGKPPPPPHPGVCDFRDNVFHLF